MLQMGASGKPGREIGIRDREFDVRNGSKSDVLIALIRSEHA